MSLLKLTREFIITHVESYLRKINHPVPLADMRNAHRLLLKAGKQDMIAEKAAKIIAQYL